MKKRCVRCLMLVIEVTVVVDDYLHTVNCVGVMQNEIVPSAV